LVEVGSSVKVAEKAPEYLTIALKHITIVKNYLEMEAVVLKV